MARWLPIAAALLGIVLLASLFQWDAAPQAATGVPSTASAHYSNTTAFPVNAQAPLQLRVARTLEVDPADLPLPGTERGKRLPPPFSADGSVIRPDRWPTAAAASSPMSSSMSDLLTLCAAALAMLLVTGAAYRLGGRMFSATSITQQAVLRNSGAGIALAEAEDELAGTRRRLRNSEARVQSLEAVLEQLKQAPDGDSPKIVAALQTAENELAEMSEHTGAADAEVRALETQLAEMVENEDRLKQELEAIRATPAPADADVSKLQKQITRLDRELSDWQELWREAEPRLSRQQKAISQLEMELEASSDTIRGLRRHIATVHGRLHKTPESTRRELGITTQQEFSDDDVDAWIDKLNPDK